jgi:nitroreductase
MPQPNVSPAELLQNRYGEVVFAPQQWNQTLTTLLTHRSVRAYRPDALPPQTLETLVAAAQSAATSSNLQTWSVVAVEDPARKQVLSELAGNQAHIRDCPLFLVWLADLARLTNLAAQRQLPAAGLDYLEMFVMATIDASLAAQNAVTAAESLDLGTVYIGGIRNQPEQVVATLQLPPHLFAVFGLCVGYPDLSHPDLSNPDLSRPAAVKPRLPQAAVLHREVYQPDQTEAIDQYIATMRQFYASQQMPTSDWASHSLQRVASAASLSGRARLKQILPKLGFPLL